MTCRIVTSFSAESPSSGYPKYKRVQAQTQRSWFYGNKMLKMLEL